MSREKPEIIKQVGFDFDWDETLVWEINAPTERMPIEELTWHFNIPFLWTKPDGYYDLKPQEVIEKPEEHLDEYERTMAADTSYPIDVMWYKEHWLILDGLHRLMKHYMLGREEVDVRKIPQSAIPLIKK